MEETSVWVFPRNGNTKLTNRAEFTSIVDEVFASRGATENVGKNFWLKVNENFQRLAKAAEDSDHKKSSGKYLDIDSDNEDPESNCCNSKSKSAHLGGHKRKTHPLLLGPSRRDPGKYVPLNIASKNNLSEFTQRIMSAKLLRVKQVQNQLSETQTQLNELINENRILRNLQKRQEGALKKYEGNHAELPQLIRSHNEEIRTLKANNKLMKAQLKESNGKLKERESELESLKESYGKLKKLCSEKNLLEREKLQKKVEELQRVIKEQQERIQVLSRKVLLESKNYRHHLNTEISKHKETQKDLSNALAMVTRLENQLLMKDRTNVIPSGLGKISQKRDFKSTVPVIFNKSSEIHSHLTNVDVVYSENAKKSNETGESPETDLELLNGLVSSDGTPSPTHDILPDINPPKKQSPIVGNSSTELRKSKLIENVGGNSRRQLNNPKMKKIPTRDVESDARGLADKLSRNIKIINDLVEKNDLEAANSTVRLSSLYNEMKTSISKIEDEINGKIVQTKQDAAVKEDGEICSETGNLRRYLSKRKLDEEMDNRKESEPISDELPEHHQQKFISMTKTWNDIKDKVQEERMKAEEKMKTLGMTERNELGEESDTDKRRSGHPNLHRDRLQKVQTSDLAYEDSILKELEKTDGIFKRLQNENKNKGVITYRTESQRMPKFLEEFQSEYQKQNLLKALKAIDVGRDEENSSDEESSHPFKKVNNEPDLFSHAARKTNKSNMEYGIVDPVNSGNI